MPEDLAELVSQAQGFNAGPQFARQLLDSLEIGFSVEPEDLSRIPARGPAVIVANHPFGAAEGLILMVLLESVRNDFKIVANSLLSMFPAVTSHSLLVNPFETARARTENLAPLRQSLDWLSRGGLLATFPAGEVAHLSWEERSVTDPPWKTTAARLALRTKSPVLPVFFDGANTLPFHLAGLIHPRLRTFNLPREFCKLRGKTVRLRIGRAIQFQRLAEYGDSALATEYLRSRTFLLSYRFRRASKPMGPSELPTVRTGGLPGSGRRLAEEVAALPEDRELASNSEFAVYLARAFEIPALLDEIGRCREAAFRLAGEGAGKEKDLDRFDETYQHLVLWNKAEQRLAGGYRLGITTDLLHRGGALSLYTNTLFRYDPEFFNRVGPAIELGRSFVCAEYQRNYSSLLMLWKGIARFVERHPQAPVLFGPVSISREYHEISRGLIATYLSDRESHELARMVSPRVRFQGAQRHRSVRRLAALTASLDDLSRSIADIEEDGKGVPVLIRHYLKSGGKLLGFNVDHNFSGVLDALILADLRTADPAMLERYMGRAEAQAFLAYHRRKNYLLADA